MMTCICDHFYVNKCIKWKILMHILASYESTIVKVHSMPKARQTIKESQAIRGRAESQSQSP